MENVEAGDWYWLHDSDTEFHHKKPGEFHPWVLLKPCTNRTAFIFVCPRPSSEPGSRDVVIRSPKHSEHKCGLNKDAHLKPLATKKGGSEWLERGSHICLEPDQSLVECALRLADIRRLG